MAIVAGPPEISLEKADQIADEVQTRAKTLIRSAQAEVHDDGKELVLIIVIPDVDPFERTRLDTLFNLAEEIITARIPADVPIRDDSESWSVTIVTDEDWGKRFATVDAIFGGRLKPTRTSRLSEPD